MDISDRQLRAFVTVCEEGSITRAAEKLFLSQPTLSRRLSALEDALGLDLVERLPRSVRPTVAGRDLLDRARVVIAAHADLDRAVRRVRDGAITDLRIGTLYSLSLGILPPLLARWRSAHPAASVSLQEHRHQADLIASLHSGAVDVAVGPAPQGWQGGSVPLLTEEFVVVLPWGDRGDSPIDMRDLVDAEWVHFAEGNGLGEILDGACISAGFRPRVALRTEQARAAVEYAVQGLGPTLVPKNTVPADVAWHGLREPVVREIRILWRGGADPAVRSLVAATRGRRA